MKSIVKNIGELLVKIFYITGLITFIVTCFMLHNDTYKYENLKIIFSIIDVLAIYSLVYSIYFLLRYRKTENQKIISLKKSRRITFYLTVSYLLSTYVKFDNGQNELIKIELLLLITIICFVLCIARIKSNKKAFNKRILWVGNDEQGKKTEQDSNKRRRR